MNLDNLAFRFDSRRRIEEQRFLDPATTDELIEVLCEGSRVPLSEVKRHPHGALFPTDPPLRVQPADPETAGRFDLANPVMLEELGLEYRVFPIDITKGEQHAPDFLGISPNNKIPAIVDHDAPDGEDPPQRK